MDKWFFISFLNMLKSHPLWMLLLLPLWILVAVIILAVDLIAWLYTSDRSPTALFRQLPRRQPAPAQSKYQPTTGNGIYPGYGSVNVIGYDPSTGAILTDAQTTRDIRPGLDWEPYPGIKTIVNFKTRHGNRVVVNAPLNSSWSDLHFQPVKPEDSVLFTSRTRVATR